MKNTKKTALPRSMVAILVAAFTLLLSGCVAMKGIGAIAGMDNNEKEKIDGVVEVVRADASRPVIVHGYGGYGYPGYYVGVDDYVERARAGGTGRVGGYTYP